MLHEVHLTRVMSYARLTKQLHSTNCSWGSNNFNKEASRSHHQNRQHSADWVTAKVKTNSKYFCWRLCVNCGRTSLSRNEARISDIWCTLLRYSNWINKSPSQLLDDFPKVGGNTESATHVLPFFKSFYLNWLWMSRLNCESKIHVL